MSGPDYRACPIYLFYWLALVKHYNFVEWKEKTSSLLIKDRTIEEIREFIDRYTKNKKDLNVSWIKRAL